MARLPKELTRMMVSGDMHWLIAIGEGSKDMLASIPAFATRVKRPFAIIVTARGEGLRRFRVA